MKSRNLVDVSVKTVVAAVPSALFRLAGFDIDPESIHPGDTEAIVRELHADDVYICADPATGERWGLYAEYQYVPDPEEVPRWLQKCLVVSQKLGFPVLLLAVYLHRGDRATFPDHLETRRGRLRNYHEFSVIRLWEHADRIRSGELVELAPLLILWEDNPGIETLRTERALIEAAPVSEHVRDELLAAAYILGLKYMSTDLLEKVFGEDLPIVLNSGPIGEAIRDALEQGREQGLERGRVQGLEQGLEQGIRQGRAQQARVGLTRVLLKRFGAVPPALEVRIGSASDEECLQLLDLALEATKIEDLLG